jgi:hypothetical protein
MGGAEPAYDFTEETEYYVDTHPKNCPSKKPLEVSGGGFCVQSSLTVKTRLSCMILTSGNHGTPTKIQSPLVILPELSEKEKYKGHANKLINIKNQGSNVEHMREI